MFAICAANLFGTAAPLILNTLNRLCTCLSSALSVVPLFADTPHYLTPPKKITNTGRDLWIHTGIHSVKVHRLLSGAAAHRGRARQMQPVSEDGKCEGTARDNAILHLGFFFFFTAPDLLQRWNSFVMEKDNQFSSRELHVQHDGGRKKTDKQTNIQATLLVCIRTEREPTVSFGAQTWGATSTCWFLRPLNAQARSRLCNSAAPFCFIGANHCRTKTVFLQQRRSAASRLPWIGRRRECGAETKEWKTGFAAELCQGFPCTHRKTPTLQIFFHIKCSTSSWEPLVVSELAAAPVAPQHLLSHKNKVFLPASCIEN